MKPLDQLSHRGRVERLRPFTVEFCRQFGLDPVRIRVVSVAFNATFKIDDASGSAFALRINVNSSRTREDAENETAWVSQLQKATNFIVPHPVISPDGRKVITLSRPEMDRTFHAVAYSWLQGKSKAALHHPDFIEKLGRATRELHELALEFVPVRGAGFKPLVDPLDGLPEPSNPVFKEVVRQGRSALKKLSQFPTIPIHGDLHLDNVKRLPGTIGIFDFDDASSAWPVIDPAISAFYLRRVPGWQKLEPYYWQGYGKSKGEFGLTETEFESITASRQVLLLADLLVNATPDQSDLLQKYPEVALRRCQTFLDTGYFDPTVATIKS